MVGKIKQKACDGTDAMNRKTWSASTSSPCVCLSPKDGTLRDVSGVFLTSVNHAIMFHGQC